MGLSSRVVVRTGRCSTGGGNLMPLASGTYSIASSDSATAKSIISLAPTPHQSGGDRTCRPSRSSAPTANSSERRTWISLRVSTGGGPAVWTTSNTCDGDLFEVMTPVCRSWYRRVPSMNPEDSDVGLAMRSVVTDPRDGWRPTMRQRSSSPGGSDRPRRVDLASERVAFRASTLGPGRRSWVLRSPERVARRLVAADTP